MQHVIIEGPDGAGKTQLARLICHRHRMGYHHEGPPPSADVLGHYARLLAEASRPTVFDRLHLGELIYGPLLRGGSALSPRDLTLMNRLVNGLGVATVICLPDWDVCQANSARKDELIKSDDLRGIAYDCWIKLLSFANPTPPVNLQLHDYTRGAFTLKRWDPAPDGVIGEPLARILFVGEQANGPLDLPFFGPRHSSQFLHDCLVEAGIPESQLALTNALDARGHARDLSFIISQMPELRVVVPLGRVAENQLERQAAPEFVNVLPVPHPQFWKRFHAAQRHQYVTMLKDVHHAAA